MTEYVIGVDGGGTKTRALLLSLTGVVLGEGQSGSSNYDNVGTEIAKENIRQAAQSARDMAGVTGVASAAFLGIAGVVSEADRELV